MEISNSIQSDLLGGDQFAELQANYAVLIQQFDTANADIKELRQQSRALANEKWELGQEKARLYGQLKQVESVSLARRA